MQQSNRQKKKATKQKALVPATIGPDKRKKRKRNQVKLGASSEAQAAINRKEKFFLSLCSKHYLRALCDPFSLESGLACVPDLIDVPSSKIAPKARGTFYAGNNGTNTGFGFIGISPTSGVNNENTVVYSSDPTTFVSTVITGFGAAGTTTSSVTQMPYTVSQRPNIKQRTVGVGIRIRYLGTELNKSGRVIGVRTNFGNSLVGLNAFSALSDAAIQSVPTKRSWTQVIWLPCDSKDYDYLGSDQGIDATDSLKAMRLGFIVDGITAGSAFEYEIRYHKEYANGNRELVNVANLSTSHSDTQGLSAIRNYFEGAVEYAGGAELYNRAINYLTSWSPSDISHVVVGAQGMARAYQGLRGNYQ